MALGNQSMMLNLVPLLLVDSTDLMRSCAFLTSSRVTLLLSKSEPCSFPIPVEPGWVGSQPKVSYLSL